MQTVIVGAGYAGLTTALRLARSTYTGNIILVNDTAKHQLTTQLHKVAAGSLAPDMAFLSLKRLLSGTNIELVVGQVTAIEPEHDRIRLTDKKTERVIAYNRLVVALGSEPESFGVSGVYEHAFHVQPIAQAIRVRDHIRALIQTVSTDWVAKDPFENGSAVNGEVQTDTRQRETLRIAIIGGGLTGVELAGELADQFATTARTFGLNPDDIPIVLIEAGPRLLPGLAKPLAVAATNALISKGVKIHTNTAVRAVTAKGVSLQQPTSEKDDGPTDGFIPAGTVIWTAGVRGNRLIEATFRTGSRGRALVDEYLRATEYPNVYIVGDNALAVSVNKGEPAAPTAQNAVQQAAVVAENIANDSRAIGNGSMTNVTAEDDLNLTPYVSRPLGLFISVGHGEAVGELVFGDTWRPRLSGMSAYALKWASEQRYKLGIGAPIS